MPDGHWKNKSRTYMKTHHGYRPSVIAGRDPAIQDEAAAGTALDHRVKPGDDKRRLMECVVFQEVSECPTT
jgi:hypothetical protein